METSGTQNLARSYSGMGTASATTTHNQTVIDMLYKDYLDNYSENKKEDWTIPENDTRTLKEKMKW